MRGLIYPVPDPALPFLGVHLTKRIDGDVLVGPERRPGARPRGLPPPRRRPSATRADDAALARHLARLRPLLAHGRGGARPLRQPPRVRRTPPAATCPSSTADDVVPAPAGVRAQAVGADGRLVDDFRLATLRPRRLGPQRAAARRPPPRSRSRRSCSSACGSAGRRRSRRRADDELGRRAAAPAACRRRRPRSAPAAARRPARPSAPSAGAPWSGRSPARRPSPCRRSPRRTGRRGTASPSRRAAVDHPEGDDVVDGEHGRRRPARRTPRAPPSRARRSRGVKSPRKTAASAPALGQRVEEPPLALRARAHALEPGDQADPPVPEREEVPRERAPRRPRCRSPRCRPRLPAACG